MKNFIKSKVIPCPMSENEHAFNSEEFRESDNPDMAQFRNSDGRLQEVEIDRANKNEKNTSDVNTKK